MRPQQRPGHSPSPDHQDQPPFPLQRPENCCPGPSVENLPWSRHTSASPWAPPPPPPPRGRRIPRIPSPGKSTSPEHSLPGTTRSQTLYHDEEEDDEIEAGGGGLQTFCAAVRVSESCASDAATESRPRTSIRESSRRRFPRSDSTTRCANPRPPETQSTSGSDSVHRNQTENSSGAGYHRGVTGGGGGWWEVTAVLEDGVDAGAEAVPEPSVVGGGAAERHGGGVHGGRGATWMGAAAANG